MIGVVCTVRGVHRDARGKVLRDHEQPLHSFVANFSRMYEAMTKNGTVATTSTTGAALNIDGGGNSLVPYIAAPVDDATYGIVLGTISSLTPSINDTQLQSALDTTYMRHFATLLDLPITDANSCSFRIRRQFAQTPEKPGGGILVDECGLVAYCQGTPTSRLLIARDVFAGSGFSLIVGHSLEIIYKISVSTL